MIRIALQMLMGDRAKYLGLIFAIAFSAFLVAQQASIFAGIMARTASQILDVVDADIWAMDRRTLYVEEVRPLPDTAVMRVRGVDGVAWAVPMLRALPTVRAADGTFRACILQGLDDATLVGAPRAMLLGKAEDLRKPDAVILDRAGFESYFPGQPLRLGDVLEINDRRAVIVGICEARAPFQTFPVLFSTFSNAREFVGAARNHLSFVLAGASPGADPAAVAARVAEATGLHATTTVGFAWQTVLYYFANTGIPINFGITIVVAIIVGTVVAGQTFYIFTIENLRQFGALKAIGVGNWQLVGMVLAQALTVALAGIGLGLGGCAAFFELTLTQTPTRGLVLLPEVGLATALLLLLVVIVASLLSLRKVLTLEPAAVFRG